ncbi:MAG: monovalent cation/H(+) antiporter subunit G [Caldilinea sp.]
MIWVDLFSIACIMLGCFFYLAGTVGLLRLPDVFTRLHALTKADNLGLGLIVLGAIVQIGDWMINLKLVLIWGLVMIASATVAHLIARRALQQTQAAEEERA